MQTNTPALPPPNVDAVLADLWMPLDNLRLELTGLDRQIQEKKHELRKAVQVYNERLSALVEEALRIRKLFVCTYCFEKADIDLAELVLFTGKKEVTSGDHGSETYDFESFSEPHRLCRACRDAAMRRSGWLGPYDHQVRDQESFYAWPIETREGKLVCHVVGEGKEREIDPIPLFPERLLGKLAAEFFVLKPVSIANSLSENNVPEIKLVE